MEACRAGMPGGIGSLEQWAEQATSLCVSDPEFWKECAAQHLRNEEFYRGLLDQCAVHLGPEVYTQDDGGHSDEPLRLKIPGAVCSLAALGPLALTESQVAYLEEKRGTDVWTVADFNRVLRSLRG